jgi:hypothetical protein
MKHNRASITLHYLAWVKIEIEICLYKTIKDNKIKWQKNKPQNIDM